MSNYNSVVQSIMCYEFNKNSFWLSVVHDKLWNRYSLDISRKFTYTKDGETKEGFCSTYLNLNVAKALVDQLQFAYQLAKKLKDNQGVEIYNIFHLIYKIYYTFLHRSTARDRDGLGRWSARGPYRSWRHRSLEDSQRRAGWMRTYSRCSRSAKCWEPWRRSLTPVCLKLRDRF